MQQPEEYFSKSIAVETGCGKMFVHLLYLEKEMLQLKEVKASLGKSGGCARSHLESKTDFINALIHYTKNDIAIKTLTKACGHRCNAEPTCHDLLIRLVIDELMKVKI